MLQIEKAREEYCFKVLFDYTLLKHSQVTIGIAIMDLALRELKKPLFEAVQDADVKVHLESQ